MVLPFPTRELEGRRSFVSRFSYADLLESLDAVAIEQSRSLVVAWLVRGNAWRSCRQYLRPQTQWGDEAARLRSDMLA